MSAEPTTEQIFVDDEVRGIADSMRQEDQVVQEDAEATAEAAPPC